MRRQARPGPPARLGQPATPAPGAALRGRLLSADCGADCAGSIPRPRLRPGLQFRDGRLCSSNRPACKRGLPLRALPVLGPSVGGARLVELD